MQGKKNYRILIVDDEIEYQKVLSLILSEIGYDVSVCSDGFAALKHISRNTTDLVITDLKMPVMDGSELIMKIRENGAGPDVIVMTAYGSIESAVDSMKYGAIDYFVKSNDIDDLVIRVGRIFNMRMLERKSEILISNQNDSDVFLETKCDSFMKLLDSCRITADSGINILLLGESGVGKEVIAHYIHNLSSRRTEPFVAVNCQTFPTGVIESELFGHEKGSFTGATEKRIGKFEQANYGTLFLDEIGDLPLETQGKLLRAIESRSIERIGSNGQIKLDVKFISATNKDLTKMVSEGTFREDLLYRINTLTLRIPSLRERRKDIPALVEFFIVKTEREQKKKIISIDDSVVDFLYNYSYPGNIRELRNIIERMTALSRDGRITMNEMLMPVDSEAVSAARSVSDTCSLKQARTDFERSFIIDKLKASNWNVAKAAADMEISSRQLWNKISQYNIEISKRE
jgi:Response regulator containing CheY-like receiver, AAA-type ATPase, and DNA-binding domains